MYFSKEWERFNGIETDYMKMYYYEFVPGYSDVYSTYSYFRLCTIIEGNKKVSVDGGEDFIYDKDQYVLLSPESKVHMAMPHRTKALVLELNDRLIEDVGNKISIERECDVDLRAMDYQVNSITNDMIQSLGAINSFYNGPGDDRDKVFFMDLAVQKMAYGLLKDTHSREFLLKDKNNPLTRGVDMFRKEYNKGITVTEVAFRLNMSLPSFTNKFKKAFNITPKQYLDGVKMGKAKEELRSKSVSEVAFDMGYSNVSSFIQKFKDFYKVTPKQFQLNSMVSRSV